MSNKRNDFQFDIPVPVIVIALLFSFPIGVILAVLRIVSDNDAKKKIKNAASKAEDAFSEFMSQNEAAKKTQTAPHETAEQGNKRTTVSENQTNTEKNKKDTKKKADKKKQKRSVWTVLASVFCVLFFILGVLGIFPAFSDGVENILGNLFRDVLPYMTVSGLFYLLSLFFKSRDSRFNRIRAIIGEKDSIHLSRIASISKQSLKKVRRDVQSLIDKGEYGAEAYIDLGTDNFMRYADAQTDKGSVFDEKIFCGKTKKEEAADGVAADEPEENSFRGIILEIRRLNDEIRDFPVSERIYRIEEYTQYIFDYVTEHPEALPKIRTFMNYYLPTTLKLLESYSRIEKMGASGENMQSSKKKIEDILDLLVEGYRQQMDHLFQNESMDISSEIKVLETMMQKDGLSGNKDFSLRDELGFGGAAAQQMPADNDTENK